ncbi:hypothetical protein CON48_26395 [Bacillus thuringiensis]|uniref:Uncharacterized protein n=1 Tax=Bacillus thuringiensis TaxID=1428 RepID=A0A9X6V5C6_BACTU|nr:MULTISPECIES: hypothetical protein [Bacillus]AJQ58811.1 hypothetical protein SD98_11070 [Bacillus thuringiensis serovar morrisoni]AMR84561.1 hypothetical protein A3L20_11225 [Bacillus thuringiensis]EOO07838.1 hypothetical protein IAW_02894 [Bacillus cereus str. Schrouff]EOO85155.1 hypothetical protein IGY_03509 [Bacillus cereus K-5975c]KIP26314.1 putative membrane protein [Bacillus thuringiensis serovar morrisoni]
MWNIKEEYLDKFRMTCNDRLSPEGATGFMFGGILYSSIAVFSIIVSGDWDYCMVLLNIGIVKLEVLLYALQVIFFILYLFPKAQFKFQKLQTIVVLLYAFQMATILLTVLVVSEIANNSMDRITLNYVCLLYLGAVIFHIVATIDTFKLASEGAFSMDERSASFFSKAKGTMMKVASIYALILLILIYFHNDYAFDTFIGYVIGTVLMYTIAIGAAEFQLLAYCRFKFPSFNKTWEQHKRETPRYRKKNKKSKSKRKA